MMPMRFGQQQIQLDLSQAVPKKCGACDSEFFDKVCRMAVISKLAAGNPTGQDIPVEFPAYLCRQCGVEFGKPVGEMNGKEAS
jgi:hypothetical protein